MLDRMRRHKGWLKWFLALVAVALCLYLIPDFLSQDTATVGATSREVIADVDGRTVTVGEFETAYQTQLERMRQQFGGDVSESLLRQLGIEQQVLRELIEQRVATIEAERQGIRVSDQELAQQILSLQIFNEGGQFVGDQMYRQILQSFNPPLTVAQFEDEMRRGMAIDRLRAALTDWIAVSDAELEREYTRRNEKVRLQMVALTPERFRDKVTVSDGDVAAHYDAHKAEYRVGEQRKIKYFVVDQELARLKVTVSPQEIQRDYNDNIARYQTPEQVRASHILFKTEGKSEAEVRTRAEAALKQVKSGGDFAALAKQLSEDEVSKAKNGDLGLFGRGQMVPEFETAAFAMKPGETSDLVKSQFGFHIIRLEEKRDAVTRPLDEVRGEIQERLAAQKANQMVADQAARLADEVKSAADLDRGAAQAGSKVQTSEFFTRDGAIPGLGVAPRAADEAFRLQNDTEVAGPVESPRGPVFLALAEKRDPYVPKLDEVKDRVRDDLIRTRAAEMSRQRAGEIAATLRSARDFSAAAKTLGLEAKDTMLIARDSALPDIGPSAAVDKVAFELPKDGVSGPIAAGDATVIIKVVERDEVTPAELKQDRETFRAQLLNERRERFFASYMARVRDRASIEVNNEVMRRAMAARGL
jgi:peptidyl-prolyl cis-trans isomerase D